MASSVMEGNIQELREAGYLAKEIAHRLPAEKQIVPTPEPNERVVFIPHFLRGLGFPLHSFVCGLMFYCGLDSHDLVPNSFLNISAFIVVCEAFLRFPPHFGLWLKVFNVKPKVVDGQHAGCGGAMVSKLRNVTWPKGTFVESIKGWQQGWFYITEPRDATWAAAPEFKSGPLMRPTSWLNKGLDWESPHEVTTLESRVKGKINKNTSLASVIQVMLFRRILPCQCRTQYMWEFNPAGPWTLR